MEDLAKAALVDELLRQRNGGNPAIVVPHGVGDAGFLHRLDHLATLDRVEGQGFFAEDHFAGGGGGTGDFAVQVGRHADVDGVDVLALEQFSPVGLDRLVAPLVGEGLRLAGVPGAGRLQDGAVLQVKEVVHLNIGVRMGPAHEAITDHADVQRFF